MMNNNYTSDRASRFSLFQKRRLGDVRLVLPLKMLANRHLLRELECTSHSLLLPGVGGYRPEKL
jgi:hypothetical protein